VVQTSHPSGQVGLISPKYVEGVLSGVRLYEQDPHMLKKVRFGGAPLLYKEYGATITPKEVRRTPVWGCGKGHLQSNIKASN
jgi:hypothetical protein